MHACVCARACVRACVPACVRTGGRAVRGWLRGTWLAARPCPPLLLGPACVIRLLALLGTRGCVHVGRSHACVRAPCTREQVYDNEEDFFFRSVHLGTECWMFVSNARLKASTEDALRALALYAHVQPLPPAAAAGRQQKRHTRPSPLCGCRARPSTRARATGTWQGRARCRCGLGCSCAQHGPACRCHHQRSQLHPLQAARTLGCLPHHCTAAGRTHPQLFGRPRAAADAHEPEGLLVCEWARGAGPVECCAV